MVSWTPHGNAFLVGSVDRLSIGDTVVDKYPTYSKNMYKGLLVRPFGYHVQQCWHMDVRRRLIDVQLAVFRET